MNYADIQAQAPKIIAGTFKGEKDVLAMSYGEEIKGTVDVMFEGAVHTVAAKYKSFEAGNGITKAFGFSALGVNKKVYELGIRYRNQNDEHDVRVGGGVVKISKMFKDAE